MQTFSTNAFRSDDATAADDFVSINSTSNAVSTARVIYGGADRWPAGPPDPATPRRKYDPFGASKMWEAPARSKTPPMFVRFNAVSIQRPQKGRRGKK